MDFIPKYVQHCSWSYCIHIYSRYVVCRTVFDLLLRDSYFLRIYFYVASGFCDGERKGERSMSTWSIVCNLFLITLSFMLLRILLRSWIIWQWVLRRSFPFLLCITTIWWSWWCFCHLTRNLLYCSNKGASIFLLVRLSNLCFISCNELNCILHQWTTFVLRLCALWFSVYIKLIELIEFSAVFIMNGLKESNAFLYLHTIQFLSIYI